jgi:hypothetical protein
MNSEKQFTPVQEGFEKYDLYLNKWLYILRDAIDELTVNWPNSNELESLTGDDIKLVAGKVADILSDWKPDDCELPFLYEPPTPFCFKELAFWHLELLRRGEGKKPRFIIDEVLHLLELSHSRLLEEHAAVLEILTSFKTSTNREVIGELNRLQIRLSAALGHMVKVLSPKPDEDQCKFLGLAEYELSFERPKIRPSFVELDAALIELFRLKNKIGGNQCGEEWKAFNTRLTENIVNCFRLSTFALEHLIKNSK